MRGERDDPPTRYAIDLYGPDNRFAVEPAEEDREPHPTMHAFSMLCSRTIRLLGNRFLAKCDTHAHGARGGSYDNKTGA